METPKTVLRLGSSVCLLALAACSGGGGGSVNTALNNTPANNSGSSSSGSSAGNNGTNAGSSGGNGSSGTTTPPPTVSIGAPDKPKVAIQGSPIFDFKTNLPPVGTQFGLFGPAVKITSSTISAAGTDITANVVFRGTATTSSGENVPVFDINIPTIGLTATNVRADGNVTAASTGAVILNFRFLNYSVSGGWAYAPGPGTGVNYMGWAATGSGTPIANVPTAGTGTYSSTGFGAGRVVGNYWVPSGDGGISGGSLSGGIALTVNFATGDVKGSLSGMVAFPTGGGPSVGWNDVSLSASINRSATNAAFNGTTSAGPAPTDAGKAGFSTAATGAVSGGFFGPHADEVGGSWSLTDTDAAGGGKTAMGVFGASATSLPAPPPAPTTFGPLGTGTMGTNTPTLAAGTTPNFKASPPPAGTVFSLNLDTLHPGQSAVTDTTATVGGGTATFQGTVSAGSSYNIVELKVPGLGLDASNLHTDGTFLKQADGSTVTALMPALTYTILGSWALMPASGPSTFGLAIGGYQSPTSGVPTSGSATYIGNSGQGSSTAGVARGTIFVPSNNPVDTIGQFNGSVNFAGGTINGSLNNMHTVPGGGVQNPWNTVNISGTLSGANVSGTTSTTDAPSGAGVYGMSSAATGKFSGAFYGPNAQELGAIWTLNEATSDGGKAAWGVIGATKQ